MNARQIAQAIILLRRLLTEVLVARAYGQESRAQAALDQMDNVGRLLPLGVQGRIVRYVRGPVDRIVAREGVLAAAERIGYVA